MTFCRYLCLGVAWGAWYALWIAGFVAAIRGEWLFASHVPPEVRAYWSVELQTHLERIGVPSGAGVLASWLLVGGAALGVLVALLCRVLEPGEKRSSAAFRWGLSALYHGGRSIVLVSLALLVAPLLAAVYGESAIAVMAAVSVLLFLVGPFLLLDPKRLTERPDDFRPSLYWPGLAPVAWCVCVFAVVTILDILSVAAAGDEAQAVGFVTSSLIGTALWVLLVFIFVRTPHGTHELTHLMSSHEARSAGVLVVWWAAVASFVLAPTVVLTYWSWKIVPAAAGWATSLGRELSPPVQWLLAGINLLELGWLALALPLWSLFLLAIGRIASSGRHESPADPAVGADAVRMAPALQRGTILRRGQRS